MDKAYDKPITLYVSPEGSDDWRGDIAEPDHNINNGPLLTIEGTLERIKQIRQVNGKDMQAEVFIRNGRYPVSSPVALKPEFGSNISFKAYPGETPVINGGKSITGWAKESINGISMWTCEIPEVKDHKWYFRQLFVNGMRRPRSRLPQKGFYQMEDVPGIDKSIKSWDQMANGTDEFIYRSGDMDTWHNHEDVDIIVHHFWIEERLPVLHVDRQKRLVKTRVSSFYVLLDEVEKEFSEYYIENVFEGLTDPGEWYLDRKAGKLYYIPVEGECLEETEFFAPVADQLLRIEGSSENIIENISFQGITFMYCEWIQPHRHGKETPTFSQGAFYSPGCIHVQNAANITLSDCSIAHIGYYGIDLGEGCQDIFIIGNHIYDTGAGGIKASGSADFSSRHSHTFGITIKENHIHDCGKIFTSGVGILLAHAYGNYIGFNKIHDLGYSGISCGWVWGYAESISRDNIIEHNHIFNIGTGLLSDLGGIYLLGRQPGTYVKGNTIHDIKKGVYGGWGIYLDEGCSYIIAEDNTVYNTDSQCFNQHFGRENTIRNNIFAFGREGIARLTRIHHEPTTHSGFEKYSNNSLTFINNIFVTDNKPFHVDGDFDIRLEKLPYRCNDNIYWNIGGTDVLKRFAASGNNECTAISAVFDWETWREMGYDSNSLYTDPLFKDIYMLDFTLSEQSPAFNLGFRRIREKKQGACNIDGPLKKNSVNPRYFTNNSGNAVYLTGSHTWSVMQDIKFEGKDGYRNSNFNYDEFLDFLESWNHNFLRLWQWGYVDYVPSTGKKVIWEPLPWERTGPGKANDGKRKFDLTKWNEEYFERLRTRVEKACRRGIYVSVMFFDGWCMKNPGRKNSPWPNHPFNIYNNTNGINADPEKTGKPLIYILDYPEVVEVQKAFMKKVMDSLNDLDNVLYEIINEVEDSEKCCEWHRYMIDYVHNYEDQKSKQHPVCMSATGVEQDNELLLKSEADWITPGPGKNNEYLYNPPEADERKVIITDTDHLWGYGGNYMWAWKSFTRGLQPIFMDPWYPGPGAADHDNNDKTNIVSRHYPDWELIRKNLGYLRTYAEKIDLNNTVPCSSLSSSGYSLANTGKEYIVYLPEDNTVEIDLSDAEGDFETEWFYPRTGEVSKGAMVKGGKAIKVTSPFGTDSVVFLSIAEFR